MDLSKARSLAVELMIKHGATARGFTFEFNNRKRAAGICSYRKRTVELSKPITILANEADVIDTILHEIAHALCPRHGHDSVWKAKFIEIGGNGKRCYSMESSLGVAYKTIAKYKGTCPKGHIFARNRRPTRETSCNHCSSKFDRNHIITWTLNS